MPEEQKFSLCLFFALFALCVAGAIGAKSTPMTNRVGLAALGMLHLPCDQWPSKPHDEAKTCLGPALIT